MRIQELERQVGIERATIRFYEKEGLITPERLENGYRNYTDADAAELKRIRLLRDLGVSLDTIRKLQQGTEDFSAVMRRQCTILQGRQEQMERARAVCERISADGMTYAELDTVRYQSLLEAPQLPGPVRQGSGGAVFEETDYREPHPWRRFFARFLDYQIVNVLLWCFLIFVLRFRPAGTLITILINYAAWFLMIPLEAAWLHFCGMEGDVIKAITFRHTWYERDWLLELTEPEEDVDKFGYWAPDYCQAVILAAIASQEELSVDEFNQLHQAHSKDCGTPCGDGLTAAYGNITFTWDLDLECYIDYDADSTHPDVYEVKLDMRIEFDE